MMKAEEIFNSCLDGKFIGREYEEGYRYVGRSLQIYFSLSKEGESWDGNKVTDSVNFLKSYDKLCDKSKAAVLSVKSYFYRNIYADSYEEQIVACKQVSFVAVFEYHLYWITDTTTPDPVFNEVIHFVVV